MRLETEPHGSVELPSVSPQIVRGPTLTSAEIKSDESLADVIRLLQKVGISENKRYSRGEKEANSYVGPTSFMDVPSFLFHFDSVLERYPELGGEDLAKLAFAKLPTALKLRGDIRSARIWADLRGAIMGAMNFNIHRELESVTSSRDVEDFLSRQERFLMLVSVGGSRVFETAGATPYCDSAVGRAYYRLLPESLRRHISAGLTEEVSFSVLQKRVNYALTIRDVWEPRPASVLLVRKAVGFNAEAATDDQEEHAKDSTGRGPSRERYKRNDRYSSSSGGHDGSRGRNGSRGRDGSYGRDGSRGRAISDRRYGGDERYRSTSQHRDDRSSSRGHPSYRSNSRGRDESRGRDGRVSDDRSFSRGRDSVRGQDRYYGRDRSSSRNRNSAREETRSRDHVSGGQFGRSERDSTPGPHRYANGDQVQNSWDQDQRPMGQRSGSRYHEYEDRRCYKCGQQGHLRWDCPRIQKREEWRTPDDHA